MTLADVLARHGITRIPCGAHCGDGWAPIVDRLLTDLVAMGWDRNVDQIKEKFGGLRFYAAGVLTKEMQGLVDAAERESARTCELCGAPGRIGGDAWWLQCLCATCRGKR
jgi:hypothetical protein